MSISKYCESARVQFAKAKDFESKRKFLLDYISKITFKTDEFTVNGFVPIKLKEYDGKNESEETGKIEFCISGKVPQWELLGRKNRKPNFSEPITRQEYERLHLPNSSNIT